MANNEVTLIQLKQILRSILFGIEEQRITSIEDAATRYAASVGLSRAQVQAVLDTPLRELLDQARQDSASQT
jgi:hypothetical protein